MCLIEPAASRSELSPIRLGRKIRKMVHTFQGTTKAEDSAEVFRRDAGSLYANAAKLPQADAGFKRQVVQGKVLRAKDFDRILADISRP